MPGDTSFLVIAGNLNSPFSRCIVFPRLENSVDRGSNCFTTSPILSYSHCVLNIPYLVECSVRLATSAAAILTERWGAE
ncbi:hypothetical protein CEXT_318491 [Caerostris extrusa]|uniref:Uncharacterized protein n=1 Tax=Caerostris extrusa TaxID=172846 RepID=A0AAV4R9C7_CAEEX|nr:hypothetical protein CEXT_318491 [Caerostris extrusa]